jgi:hypothetical protein
MRWALRAAAPERNDELRRIPGGELRKYGQPNTISHGAWKMF